MRIKRWKRTCRPKGGMGVGSTPTICPSKENIHLLIGRTMEASKPQTWAVFCATGYDIRTLGLSRELVGNWLTRFNSGESEVVINEIIAAGGILKKKVSAKVDYQELYDKAHAAGMDAVSKLNVVPMVVQERADPLNDNSPVRKQWIIDDGVCGFAWITVRPGNSAFAKWLKAKGLARIDHYEGGMKIWISLFNQSMQKKETYASAFAQVIRDAGIKCYSGSRMD